MASVVVQAYIGGLRAEPPVGLKPEPLARGENPPEAEKLFLDVQWKPQMCPFFKIWKHNEIRYLCSSLQRNQGWLQNWGACAPPPSDSGLKSPLAVTIHVMLRKLFSALQSQSGL